MATDSSKKPVILIGLGGIGSRIVDDVYARVDEERRNQVVAIVLDTDSGDLSKL
jgi:cell division GTPase FtsZ